MGVFFPGVDGRQANCFFVFFVGTYRPANSHDSPVSRTIFELFSRPHNTISQSHVFWGNIILIWNVTLLNKKRNFAGNASACWSLDGALSHNLAMKVAYWKKWLCQKFCPSDDLAILWPLKSDIRFATVGTPLTQG